MKGMDLDMPTVRVSCVRPRFLVILMVTLLVCAAGPISLVSAFPVAGDQSSRSHTEQYVGGLPFSDLRADLWFFCGTKIDILVTEAMPVCATFDVKRSEKWITVAIEDASGLDIPAWVMRDRDGAPNDGINRGESTWICGATEKPIKIKPFPEADADAVDGPVRVVLHTDSCDRGGPNEASRAATVGTVTVTFYKKRPPKG